MGIQAPLGNTSCSMDKEGSPRSAGGRLTVPSFATVRADTVACVPTRPQSSKARFHERRRKMFSTVAPTHSMSAGLPSRPSVAVAVAACTLSSKVRLNKAKTCVSQGCSAQVILAGTKK